jgi:hypothetical protein
MKIIIFILGLAHMLVLFASAIALTLFILKRLARWFIGLFTREPAEQKPAVPRGKVYSGTLTGRATVRLPHGLQN